MDTLCAVDILCEKDDPELQRMMHDCAYYDENTWERLDPKQVQKGERDEYERFCKMGVYEYANRSTALADEDGKFVKVDKERGGRPMSLSCPRTSIRGTA